ncbi:MAG: LacI family DNA-binding transcriptional regulator [Thermomicrobiales bacterium]|nr:LacI family DNA-binding transcriptional regulator [Thermomicrobiales bacterium]
MPNIKSVAAHAKVSSATVSRVLNNDPRVSPEVRDRVRAAVAELGYRPNRVARSLRKQSSETIGVIVSDIENPHFTRAVRTIENAAYEQGYRVILCNTDESTEKQQAYLEVLAAEQVTGIILAPAAADDPTISLVLDLGVPIVAFDRTVDDERADAVLADNVTAVETATNYLIGRGRAHIGFIAGRSEIRTGRDRLRGYEQAVAAAGREPIIGQGGFRLELAQQATSDLLRAHPELDGLVVGNNLMAIGALKALQENGIQVPQDIALVGIDDPPWSALVSPAMTTLAQPTQTMATVAFELLVSRIRKERSMPREMVYQFDLRVRESCGE